MSITDWSDPTTTLPDDDGDQTQGGDGQQGGGQTDEGGVTIVRGERRPNVRTGKAIPQNILAIVRDTSRRSGVPEWALIAVIQQENGSFNPKAKNRNADGSVDHGLTQINDRWRINDFGSKDELVSCAEDPSCSIDYLAHSLAGTFKNERNQPAEGAPESDEVLWLNAAANWHRSVRDEEWSDYRQRLVDITERGYVPSGKKAITPTKPKAPSAAEKRNRAPATIQDVYDLYEELLGRPPQDDAEAIGWGRVGQPYGTVRQDIGAGPEAALWRQTGAQIKDTRSWANALFRQYTGKEGTNDEMRSVARNGWNPDQLEDWLRSRPYGKSTLGGLDDARRLADKYAQKFLGRRADAGEVNWMLSNLGRVDEDNVSAFYEQSKQRLDSGDPAFAWVADPKTWRDRQGSLQKLWADLGLRGEIDPRLVNSAISEKWSDEDATARLNGLPAPGYPAEGGFTVGEVNRVRAIARPWKQHYFPGEDVTREEVVLFKGHGGVEGNEAIRQYYRSLPADWSGQGPLPKPVSHDTSGDAMPDPMRQRGGQDLVHRIPPKMPFSDFQMGPVMEQGKEPTGQPKGEPDTEHIKRHFDAPVMRA